MPRNYAFVGEFNNGYAFIGSRADFNSIGLIDNNGVEVLPTEYHDIVGCISDNFMIGVCMCMKKCYRSVDWDNEYTGYDYVHDGYLYYLLDKEGQKFRLDIDSRCMVNYEGEYNDGSLFKFTYKKDSYSDYYDVFKSYTFYPGNILL